MNKNVRDGLERIERALEKANSKQPRFKQNEFEPGAFFSSTLRWVTQAQDTEPEYRPDNRIRDRWLATFWQREPHLAGVLSSVNAIDSNRGWVMIGGRNQVARYTSVLHGAEDGAGWRQYISQQSLAYYTADIGALTETGRDGKNGPLRAIYNLDPTKCRLTGDRKAPLQYDKTKKPWSEDDFFRLVSMRSVLEEYYGLGFCAVSRVLDLVKIMLAVYTHENEMLGARAPKGLLLLQNVSENQWKEAMKARDASLDSDMRRYYNAVAVIAQEGVDSIDAKLIALSQLPEGFDIEVFTNLLMYAYALCIGYDPIEFWPVLAGQLGRGRETDIQHRKGTGKGGLNFMLAFQEQLQEQLPETVHFEFEQRDQEGVLLDAQVGQAWADLVMTLYGGKKSVAPGPSGPAGGDGTPTDTTVAQKAGVITLEEARSLLATAGVIPASWTSMTEDVMATDASPQSDGRELEMRKKREIIMENETVRRAAFQFPDEPIIRYHWQPGTRGRTEVLFERGSQAFERTRYTLVKPVALIEEKAEEPLDGDEEAIQRDLKEWDEIPLDLEWIEVEEEIDAPTV